ncbi:Rrf2 family transcriptional regulator [Amphibacillus sediminis]|uniref:Rrf2 family transcriptional regulator n=1 Tax=Amphibacillus sediminis TaxID=360185 RepID=UPI000832C6EE|nr:Rrf2 family transcriptional regulator [Amphibacillus sediminis]
MINTKLSVAIHILSMVATSQHQPVTSDYIAASVNTNPVVIRRISSQLKKAGLITAQAGKPGFILLKNIEDISLLMIYQAVQTQDELFSIHNNPNPQCWIGKNIQATLDQAFLRAQQALENELAEQKLSDIIQHLSTQK